MARIAVTSYAYLGDVAPFIPVARRLHAAGHDVRFVAPEGFRSALEGEPFPSVPYAMDCSPAAMDADDRHVTLMKRPIVNGMRLAQYWMDKALTDDPALALASMQDAFDGMAVVVTHPTTGVIAIPVAKSVGAATVVGQLFPMMIPTAQRTPPLLKWTLNLGRPAKPRLVGCAAGAERAGVS